jgi:DNA-directed RNA polymerase subunit RPC12/RpoP
VKRTVVDAATGDVVCPYCGARNNFVSKRTGKAKIVGVATVGVGVLAMPKRLKCNGCGSNLKRGGFAAQRTARAQSRKELTEQDLRRLRWAMPLGVAAVIFLIIVVAVTH